MLRRFISLLLLAMLALTSVSCSKVKDPSSKDISAKLDAVMVGSMSEFKAPGMMLAIYVPGKTPYVKAMGLSDIKRKKLMDVTQTFRIGSNTKTFTSTVILQLVDEGKLKLSDKLDKYFPKVPGSEGISIEMLLNHTSGLFNYSEDSTFGEMLVNDRVRYFTPAELISFAVKHKPYFEPGRGFHYSNTNTVLLGMIVGKVTGHSLEDEIKSRLIDRLGLKNTYFPKAAETYGDIVHGYMIEDGRNDDWTKENVSWGWAAGAMISDISDLKTFITAVTDGTLLSGDLQEDRMTTWVDMPGLKDFPSARYGYNVFTFGGYIGHNGGLPGYISFMVRNPDNGSTIVMMMNVQPDDKEASLKVLKRVINVISPLTRV